MAIRPIFLPNTSGRALVTAKKVEFTWFAGMSLKQKQKSIEALHQAAARLGIDRVLEISTKSTEQDGIALSAFNLGFTSQKNARQFTVESVFQGSKVFEHGGPYIDLYQTPSRDAKRDERLTTSGRLTRFNFFREDWPLEPLTAFYDWVYLNTLIKNPQLAATLTKFSAFSDIEFNPERSINCQAYSAALYCSLKERHLLEEALSSKERFLAILGDTETAKRILSTEQPAFKL